MPEPKAKQRSATIRQKLQQHLTFIYNESSPELLCSETTIVPDPRPQSDITAIYCKYMNFYGIYRFFNSKFKITSINPRFLLAARQSEYIHSALAPQRRFKIRLNRQLRLDFGVRKIDIKSHFAFL